MLDHSCQVQCSPLSERGDDAYMTPAVAARALLRHVQLPRRLWECACGDGTGILDPVRAAGYEVIGSDLVSYERPDCFWRHDFLMELKAPAGCEAIVTNPPFKLAEQFVAHALELCPRVIMLLRLAFFESERRCELLEARGLARILVFGKRLPMMHTAKAGRERRATAAWRSRGSSGTAATPGRQRLKGSRGSGDLHGGVLHRNHRRISPTAPDIEDGATPRSVTRCRYL